MIYLIALIITLAQLVLGLCSFAAIEAQNIKLAIILGGPIVWLWKYFEKNYN